MTSPRKICHVTEELASILFKEDFSTLQLDVIYGVESADDMVDILNFLINECLDRHAPLRKVKVTRPQAPWIALSEIRELQAERDKLRVEAHINTCPEAWGSFQNQERTMVTTPDGNAELWELIDSFHEPDGRSFTLPTVTDGEVLKELYQLRSDCSTGVDQIPVKYVKLVRDQFMGPVNHIINVCVSTSHFPRI